MKKFLPQLAGLGALALAGWACLAADPRAVPVRAARAPIHEHRRGAPERNAVSPSWWQRVTQDLTRHEYDATLAHGSLQAPNRAQDLRAHFGAGRVALEPRRDARAWSLEWRMTSWGRGDSTIPCEPVAPAARGARVSFLRPGIEEWYENTPRGLEQGFTIPRRPRGSGRLRVVGRFGGSLGNPVRTGSGGDPGGLAWSTVGEGARAARTISYRGLMAEDAAGRSLPATLALRGSELRLEVDDARAIYPVTIDPIFDSSSFVFLQGAQASALFGAAVSTAGDVNGDGCSDLVVGAPDYDNGQGDEGAAFLYLGADTGLVMPWAWHAEGNQSGAHFGAAVAPAGDVDGDGYQDLLVGAPDLTTGFAHEGRAFLFRGAASLPSATPSWTFDGGQANAHLGAAVAGAGDVNGDHDRDVVVGAADYDSLLADRGRALVFLGGPSGLASAPTWIEQGGQAGAHFGAALAGSGDVNGDGFGDIAVGAPDWTSGPGAAGAVFVYAGSPTGPGGVPAASRFGAAAGEKFGAAIAMAGSVDGDNYCDLVVGAALASAGLTKNGRAVLYRGSASGLASNPAWSVAGDQDSARFGASVATAGDVDGDGYAEVIVGAPDEDFGGSNRIGEAFLYLGSRTGLPTAATETLVGFSQTSVDEGGFGTVVGTAGDINGDGFSDVFAAGPFADFVLCDDCLADPDVGYVELFYGHADKPQNTPQRSLESNQAQAQLGFAVACAGDANGDGRSDVLVGAPLYDAGQADEGRAFLYVGTDSGLAAGPGWTGESNQAGARMGSSVASAGDVNGDGFSDLVIGAPGYDEGHVNNGKAMVFLGRAAAESISSVAAWSFAGDRDSAQAGSAVATAGDVNGDGYADVLVGAPGFNQLGSKQGAFYAFAGSDTGLSAVPGAQAFGPAAAFGLGTAIATAGDVNGDGLADALVGTNGAGARIYYGRPSLTQVLDSLNVWSVSNPQGGSGFGSAVAPAGDVNGDGFSDVLIGAPNFTGSSGPSAGRVFFYRGALGGPSTVATQFLEVVDPGAHFGTAVSGAGDLDADARPDVVVGAPTVNVGHLGIAGAVYAFSGAGGVLVASPMWAESGPTVGAQFGAAVAGRMDVNGDGFGDLVVGAPGYANGLANEGGAFVYLGNRGSGVAMRLRLARSGGGPAAKSGRPGIDAFAYSIDGRFGSPAGAEYGGSDGNGCGRLCSDCCAICDPNSKACSGGTLGGKGTFTNNDSALVHVDPTPGSGSFWFLRLETASAYFPHTRWFTSPYSSWTEISYRTPGPMVDDVPGGSPGGRGVQLSAAPSPFLEGTHLRLDLPRAGWASVIIVDVAGRYVARLHEGALTAGLHVLPWDGRRDGGAPTGAGVYFAVTRFEGRMAIARLVRIGR